MKYVNRVTATAVAVLGGVGLIALTATPAQAAQACQPTKAYDETVVVTPESTLHHDALTHDIVVNHAEVSHVVHHDEVSHVVHHDAVTHVVHHDAVTHEVTVVDQEASDEVVVDHVAYDETIPGAHHDAVTQVQYQYVKQGLNHGKWTDLPQYLFIDWSATKLTTINEPGLGTYHFSGADEHDGDTSNVIKLGDTNYRVIVHVRTVTVKAAYDDPSTVVHHDAVTHTVHHDAVTHQETVVDSEAYDETIVDAVAYDETVVDSAAYDETVIDQAAYDETVTVVDKEAYDETVPAVTKTVHHNGVTCQVVVVSKKTLAYTGSEIPWYLVGLAGAGIAGGAAVLVARRARHRKSV